MAALRRAPATAWMGPPGIAPCSGHDHGVVGIDDFQHRLEHGQVDRVGGDQIADVRRRGRSAAASGRWARAACESGVRVTRVRARSPALARPHIGVAQVLTSLVFVSACASKLAQTLRSSGQAADGPLAQKLAVEGSRNAEG